MKTITTCTQTVTLGQYCAAWRMVKAAAPGTEFRQSLCGWWPASREEILAQFSHGVHDRINRHLPWWPLIWDHAQQSNPD